MERLGKTGPQLVAELTSFSAADALQWAESSRWTGHLTFRSNGARITLQLENGGILLASSNRRFEGLGRFLFAEGLIDEIDLAAALVYSREAQSRLGSAMVELEVLSESDVRKALFHHTVDLATLPVAWSVGWISAEVLPPEPPDSLDPEAVDTMMVLMEAARRSDELMKIRRALPSDDGVLARGGEPLPEDAPARWRRVVESCRAGLDLRSQYEAIGGSHFHFLESAAHLVETRVLTLVGAAKD